MLFLDRHNRITQVNLTYIIPGTTVVRSVAITADVIAKLFGDYHYADGRLRLESKGTYATGADSPDETLSLAWTCRWTLPSWSTIGSHRHCVCIRLRRSECS